MITRGRSLCVSRGVPLRVSATGSLQLLNGRKDNKANQSIKKLFPFKKLSSVAYAVKGIPGVWSLIQGVGAKQSIKKRFPFENRLLSFMLADNKANQSIKKRFPVQKTICSRSCC